MSNKLIKDGKEQIFKVQRPMATNGDCLLLIYNQSRSIYSQIPITQEIAKYMGADYKIYIKGYVDKSGMLQVTEKVGTQRW